MGPKIKLKFAEPKASDYEEPVVSEREDMTKEEVIQFAMECYQWKESKVISWYKLQIPQLGGNSPMELVQRKQTGKLIIFLKKKAAELAGNSSKA